MAELWRGFFKCGAKEFKCGGAATLNGPWRTLMIIPKCYMKRFNVVSGFS
jgi:hypothetical protein